MNVEPKTIVRILGRTVAALLLLGIALLAAQLAITHEPDERYILPNNFTGYFAVVYGVRGGSEYVVDDEGRRVFRIPQSGILCMKPSVMAGWMSSVEYHYRDGQALPRVNPADPVPSRPYVASRSTGGATTPTMSCDEPAEPREGHEVFSVIDPASGTDFPRYRKFKERAKRHCDTLK